MTVPLRAQRARELLLPPFVGEAVLRLALGAFGLFFLLVAILGGLSVEGVTEAVFQRGLQQDAQRIFNKKIIREGGGQISIWDRFEEARKKDPTLRFADLRSWLARQSFLPGEDEDVLLWERFLWEYRVAAGMLCGACGLVGFLVLAAMFAAWGPRPKRPGLGRWIFAVANPDYARNREGERVLVKDFSPLHRKIFDLSYRLARNNSHGEFLYVLDEFARLLTPGDEDAPPHRIERVGMAFAELARDRFFYEHRRGRHEVAREFRLLEPIEGRTVTRELEVEGDETGPTVFEAGVFRIDGELFGELLKDKFPRPPDQTLFTLDEEEHEYAYEIMAVVEDYFGQNAERREIHLWDGDALWLPLRRLLGEANVNLVRAEASKCVGKIHRDLDHLVDLGFLASWSIRDGEGEVKRDWASTSYLYTVNPTTHRRELNWPVLAEKRYGFRLPPSAGNAADTLRLEPSPALRLLHLPESELPRADRVPPPPPAPDDDVIDVEGHEVDENDEPIHDAPAGEEPHEEDGTADEAPAKATPDPDPPAPPEDTTSCNGDEKDEWMTRSLRSAVEDD